MRMTAHLTLILVLCALISGVDMRAQATPPKPDDVIRDAAISLSRKAKSERTSDELYARLGPGGEGMAQEIGKKLRDQNLQSINFLQIGESAAQSIDNGNSSLSSATSSIVTKAVGSILGVAEEAGAVSSSSSGSATTITANIPQLALLMVPGDKPCYVIDNCGTGSTLLAGASASVSFNSSSSTMPSGISLSSAAQAGVTGTQTPVFSGFAFHENFHGRKNTHVTPAAFAATLKTLGGDPSTASLEQLYHTASTKLLQFYSIKDNKDNYDRLVACYAPLTGDTLAVDLAEQQIDTCLDLMAEDAASIAGMKDLLTQLEQAQTVYFRVRDAALSTMFYSNTFALEYDLTNNLNQPMTSTIKGVYGNQALKGTLQTTANGSVTLYNSLQGSSESRMRSAQAAVQLDYSPATKARLQAVYSGGYYFQYMVANGLIDLPSTAFAPGTAIPLPNNASVLLNTTGPIHIGQGKVTLKVKNTNISIPLALTIASRTDLIKANRVSGNFGISYDFSSLLSGTQNK